MRAPSRSEFRLASRFAVAAILAGLAFGVPAAKAANEVNKDRPRDFVIAGSDGYGTQDCLAGRSNCGRIVADAWCEAKGFKGALAYRQLFREEVTGTTGSETVSAKAEPASSQASRLADQFLISCKD